MAMTEKVLHPITMTFKPYPWWERYRVAASILFLGRVTFQAEISDFKATP